MPIELLAPAKDKDCAFAAIDFGADAIYIGAKDFGARKKAGNNIKDIEEVVNYAHKFNVKIYVTLNTILNDEELKEAEKMIRELEEINVDALIVQDMGLLEIPHKIPFHASTQCDNRTIEKVKFLEEAGFKRVVLARELSLEQIKKIKDQTNVELECFIHGALCVSYSGQCYMSYSIGKRSANRGECAQPCRKKYSLIDDKGNIIEKDKYLLSLKDFCAAKHIKELAQIGVVSFKIEGRLKDSNYVKNVVGYYRKLIDNLGLEKTSSGEILFDFEPNIEKSFNRGFSDYFLEKRKNCFNMTSPKSIGEYLGKIKTVEKDFFTIENLTKQLSPQDGLCFIDNNELNGFLINKIDNKKIYPNKKTSIKIGTDIYRNQNTEFEKQLKNSKTHRYLKANIEFNENEIITKDEDGNIAKLSFETEEIAKNPEKMIANIKTQFKKTGNTNFEIEEVSINTNNIPFLPISKLNELRREILDKLIEERLKNYPRHKISNKTNYPKLNKSLDYKANILNEKAKNFYKKCGCEINQNALESGLSPNGLTVMRTKHCLKYAFNMCKKDKKLFLVDEKNKKYKLNFDCKNCEMEIIF